MHEEGITFVHGPNGCGKTTSLKLIAAFIEWDLAVLNEINFDGFEIFFNTNKRIQLKKTTQKKTFEEEEIEVPVLSFALFDGEESIDSFEVTKNVKEVRIPPSQIDEYIPFLHQIGARHYLNSRTDERMTYHEVIERFSHRLPFGNRKKRPEWLHELQEGAKLHFVQTQRLLKVTNSRRGTHREERDVSNVIDIYSSEMKERISMLLARSAAVSQSKDRSFPQRLLSMKLDEGLSEEKIRTEYQSTEEKIQALMASGLIEQEKNISLPSKKFEATEKKVLSLYLQDINEKLEVFDRLAVQVETLLKVVSKKLRNKKLKVSPSEGFLIETTQGEKYTLKPEQLSSGEQHQIVLFYELIFKTTENSFFLIDEPEISLHIDWQRQFLSDISEIAKLGNHSFLVATHSPQIIGARRDLSVSLDGGILCE